MEALKKSGGKFRTGHSGLLLSSRRARTDLRTQCNGLVDLTIMKYRYTITSLFWTWPLKASNHQAKFFIKIANDYNRKQTKLCFSSLYHLLVIIQNITFSCTCDDQLFLIKTKSTNGQPLSKSRICTGKTDSCSTALIFPEFWVFPEYTHAHVHKSTNPPTIISNKENQVSIPSRLLCDTG